MKTWPVTSSPNDSTMPQMAGAAVSSPASKTSVAVPGCQATPWTAASATAASGPTKINSSPGAATAANADAGPSTPWNATLRTTCVATELQGGHAKNALPQLAGATNAPVPSAMNMMPISGTTPTDSAPPLVTAVP